MNIVIQRKQRHPIKLEALRAKLKKDNLIDQSWTAMTKASGLSSYETMRTALLECICSSEAADVLARYIGCAPSELFVNPQDYVAAPQPKNKVVKSEVNAAQQSLPFDPMVISAQIVRLNNHIVDIERKVDVLNQNLVKLDCHNTDDAAELIKCIGGANNLLSNIYALLSRDSESKNKFEEKLATALDVLINLVKKNGEDSETQNVEIVRRLQQLNVQLSPARGFNTIGNAVKSK